MPAFPSLTPQVTNFTLQGIYSQAAETDWAPAQLKFTNLLNLDGTKFDATNVVSASLTVLIGTYVGQNTPSDQGFVGLTTVTGGLGTLTLNITPADFTGGIGNILPGTYKASLVLTDGAGSPNQVLIATGQVVLTNVP